MEFHRLLHLFPRLIFLLCLVIHSRDSLCDLDRSYTKNDFVCNCDKCDIFILSVRFGFHP